MNKQTVATEVQRLATLRTYQRLIDAVNADLNDASLRGNSTVEEELLASREELFQEVRKLMGWAR